MKRFLLLSLFFLASVSTKAADTLVYYFELSDEIAAPAWWVVERAVNEAHETKADILFLNLDTYGGQVDMADSIRTKLLRANMPVFVLINNNAASAGALISIACDSIYMMPGSTIGAATVVDQSGQPVPDKYQSYMRSKMRATAEETGRNPDIAEAMVDPDKEVPGVSAKGKVLTFTTSEAIANGYCNGEVESFAEAMVAAGITGYRVEKYKVSTAEKIILWLINPAISGVLILIIMGGIYFELQTPGVGFPILAAITAAVLFFAPYYLEGIAENWEVSLFFVGLVLVALEVFVIPGFGVAGISGGALIVSGLVLSMVRNDGFDFDPVPMSQLFQAFAVVITASVVGILGVLGVAGQLLTTGAFSRFVLQSEERTEDGYVGTDQSVRQWIGQEGVAYTDLRPSGKVKLGNDIYDAVASEGYIEKSAAVIVERYEAAQLVVRTRD